MATSFGDGGGRPDLKRLLGQPWVILVGVLIFGAVGFFWLRSRASQAAVAQQGLPNPMASPSQVGADVLATADLNGIQQQLSNLLQQVSVSHVPSSGAATSTVGPQAFIGPASGDPWAAANLGRGAAIWSTKPNEPGVIEGWIPYGSPLASFSPTPLPQGNEQITLPGGGQGLLIGSAIQYR